MGETRRYDGRSLMVKKLKWRIGVAPQGVLWGIKDGLFGGRLKKHYPALQKGHDKELFDGDFVQFVDSGGDRTVYIRDLVARVAGPLSKIAQKEFERIIKDNTRK